MTKPKIAAAVGFANSARMRKAFAADQQNEVEAAIDKCVQDGVDLDSEEAAKRVNDARMKSLTRHKKIDRDAHDRRLIEELEERKQGLQHQVRIVDEALRRIRAVPR